MESVSKLTNEEIAQAQGKYLFSDCEWVTSYRDEKDILNWDEPRKKNYYDLVKYIGRTDWIKPVLTPLSRITDEHKIELAKIIGGCDHLSDEGKISAIESLFCTNSLYNKQTNIPGVRFFYAQQYLLSKGYAVPLFFDINHWANNQDAIELGIATESPIKEQTTN